jgi:phosphate transport system permease protein
LFRTRGAVAATEVQMPLYWLVLIIVAIAAIGYAMGRSRALASAGGDSRRLHSLPSFYGYNVALTVLTPALGLLVLWLLVQPLWIDTRVSDQLPGTAYSDSATRDLLMSDVRRVSEGLGALIDTGRIENADVAQLTTEGTDLRALLAEFGVALASDVDPAVLKAAQDYRALSNRGAQIMWVATLLAALGGFAVSYLVTNKDFRARNTVENGILIVLVGAASIAILTTLGIVLSMVFETRNFFSAYSWVDFFFGTNWAPDFRGNSELAILPLLWGTLYISFIALLVAVPIGLFAAIYLSEYASRRVRTFAKPAIEILAGIPTIVYGLFALITVGPMLRDYFAMPLGLGQSSSSVATAGLVMGIMLIPFVSSLSDDIINAVPQAMRDGSYGLGATQSETIRQVIIPAALPGIVGAILLAASRAIGETMIVVLGAGAAAAQFNRGLGELVNPFEAMTTVTVKIVSQLTGDTDFASPETLVAFALGLTLFVITLCLNILALWIVRRYREQYE